VDGEKGHRIGSLVFNSPRGQSKQAVFSATVQKWTEWSEGKVSEARGPDGGGRLLEDPEFGGGMEEDGDVFFGGGSDLEAATNPDK
jgi:hypothetical protein